MDTEQQIRLNFLDEAEEYFDLMESNLIGLADAVVDSQKVDLILRSAHSIKGGAAMMGFDTLSGIAHCLEDFFKILRVRYSSSQITTEVETLLLQGVDLLRDVSKLNQKGVKVTKSELNERTQPIFPKLHQKLGDLEDADENALLAQDEEVDPAVLIFEEGVDAVLDRFETKSKELEIAELSQELTKTAQELIGFGKMASLEPFIQLCQSIQKEARSLSPSEIAPLAEQALKAWRRSHALVLRGRIEKLPSCLEGREKLASETENRHNNIDFPENNFLDLSDLPFTPTEEAIEADFELVEQDFAEASQLQSAFEIDADAIDSPEAIEADFELVEQDFAEASQLQSAFEIDATVTESPEEPKSQTNFAPLEHNFIFLELNGLQSTFEIGADAIDSPEEPKSQTNFAPLEHNFIFLELNGLQSTFEIDAAVTDSPEAIEADFDPLEQDFTELNQLQSAFEIGADAIDSQEEPKIETDFDPLEQDFAELNQLQSAFEIDADVIEKKQQTTTNSSTNFLSPQKKNFVDKMVRVPVSQLKQFNSLFEQLILDRNTIGLRLKQLQNVMSLMNQRMIQIERSNTQLKQWYDRASIEGLLSTDQQQAVQNSVNSLTSNHDLLKDKLKSDLGKAQTYSDRFDTLEMDRYSDVHLICQEQIETIVQLQEVSTDIELGLQEISQAVRNLDYTTKSMQGNVTRTQMLPFAEVVKRFPRVIRDLNIQFNKQVDLKIIGENSLLDRSIIEALSDPLMHLLRNAFDHGIEDTETRIAAGKPPSGTITIQANSRGTYTIITVSDDGGGISLDKIRDRVCQMGIPQSEVTQIPEADLLDFIFDPGFSTAKQATELSGRGVGMDVVRTNLEEIRGNVRVETKPGEGTTFTLRIPFTLSILRVAIIEQAGIILAIPANSIREIVPLELEKVKISEDNKYIPWNQTEIPLVEIEKTLVYHRVHNSFGLTENPAIDRPMAILIKDGKTFAALRISRFWHEQESTMRLIDSPIPLPSGIISSMVFGDGKVIPLIDPIILIEECLSNKSTRDRSYQNHHLNRNLFTTETILVVDDSINVRRYLCLTLEKAGYRVEQAKDGQEAVDKLLGGLSAQAVICDIEMPRLDGYGVLEEIKERAEFTQLPIIMLTSRSNEKHQKLAMNLGASAYLTKPYNEQQLLNRLAKLLDD